MSAPSSAYLMGHTDRERRRLAFQATILKPLTESFFVRAGLASGMKVLDLGCGVGDVAMIAANLVGPGGHVTGIDMDAAALRIARARAAEARLRIHFEHGKVENHHAQEPYDAIVGRHILIHTPDPFAVLAQAAAQVCPGGIVAFQEYDLSRYFPATPAKPLWEKAMQLKVDFFRRVTHADIGVRLLQMFSDVGLRNVQSRAEILLGGGPDCEYYDWMVEGLRSILPMLDAAEVVAAKELALETLPERLKQEALTVGGYVTSPFIVSTSGFRRK